MFSKLFNKNKNIYFNEPPSLVDSKVFKSLLKEKFAPMMRKHGFTGSGFKYMKNTGDHYIYYLNIQASKYGGACCIEMGVHIDFIPALMDEKVDIKKFSVFNSDYRTRLSPELEDDFWWKYGNSIDEARISIEDMINMFESYGFPFFEQFKNFPHPFVDITIADLEEENYSKSVRKRLGGSTEVRIALTIARIYMFLNNVKKSKEYGEWGLKNVGQGVGLIPIFESLKEGKFK